MRFIKRLKVGKYDHGFVTAHGGQIGVTVLSRDVTFHATFPGRGEIKQSARLVSVAEAIKALGVDREFTGEAYGGYAIQSDVEGPMPLESATGASIAVDGRAFAAAWDWAFVAAAHDTSRFGFHGIKVDGSVLVGTDGKRLHYSDVPGMNLPPAILPLVVGTFLDEFGGGCLKITVDPTRVTIYAGGATMTAMLVEGQYPDYRAVIPTPSGVAVPMAPIAEHAKKGKPFTSRESSAMRVVSVDGRIHVRCQKPDVGTYDGDTGIEAEIVPVAFNPDYFIDACPRKTTPTIRWSKPNQPATVEIGDGRHAVLMPITLRNA